jgi:predicted Zn finger-like uncharacterized protein
VLPLVQQSLVREVGVTVTCPQCQTQYRYEAARFGAAESKRLKCPKCGTVFEVRKPGGDEADVTNVDERQRATMVGAVSLDSLQAEPEAPELPELPPLADDLRLSLAVIAGAQAGSVFPIGKPRMYLGRGANMDVQLIDAEVSRRHVMLEVRDEEATVVDLGSTNGIFVAGRKIERATLTNQGEFSLGSTTLMFIVTPLGESS